MQYIDKLIESVETGTLYYGIFSDSLNTPFQDIRYAINDQVVWMAYNGSLDAAKTLHEAVLHNHVISSLDWKWGGLVEAHIFEVSQEQWHEPDMAKFIGRSSTPARAWLIAILKAYKSKVQE